MVLHLQKFIGNLPTYRKGTSTVAQRNTVLVQPDVGAFTLPKTSTTIGGATTTTITTTKTASTTVTANCPDSIHSHC